MKIVLTAAQIKEIADDLDCGMRCFVHRQTGTLLSIPDTLRNPDMDTEGWKALQNELDKHFGDYFEIDQLTSRDSFEIMTDFADQLDEKLKLKSDLIQSLNKKNPFREFNFVIHHSGVYR